MYKSLLSVGGLTLLSRATGFLRDVVLSGVVGAGIVADAFFVAFRLPNHLRAIFSEGAFNAAYVPSYAQVLERDGDRAAHSFSSQIFSIMIVVQIVLLGLAWLFTPTFVDLLAPGFRDNPEKFALTVTMTRVTFPYLLFITVVTLQSGTLNANGRFAAAAFAPVLLNLSTMAFLGFAWLFPNAGLAASYGTTVSGFLQLMLTGYAAYRLGLLERFERPRLGSAVRTFFARLGPAVIGSAGAQIAMFADTIIASMLPTGGVSSIYYADRMYQLPLGVIGIAAGTVLLPEMSRRLANGDVDGAYHAQNRTAALSIALTAPFFIAFIMIPDWIMRAVFQHGAFSGAAADRSAAVLEAYGFGLMSIVLIRSATASFLARGDTRTPMYAALFAFGLNIILKIILYRPFGAVGLAIATAGGSWLNLVLLVGLANRRGLMKLDLLFARTTRSVVLASVALAVAALVFPALAIPLVRHVARFRLELAMLFIGTGGALVYGAALIGSLQASGMRLQRFIPSLRIRGPSLHQLARAARTRAHERAPL